MVLGLNAPASAVPGVVAQVGYRIPPSMEPQDALDTKSHLVSQLAFGESLYLLAVE